VRLFGLGCARVAFIVERPEDTAILQAVIAVAKSRELRVVAQGVESEAQAAPLRAMGCDLGQGFLFGRPLPPAEFANFVKYSQGGRERVPRPGPSEPLKVPPPTLTEPLPPAPEPAPMSKADIVRTALSHLGQFSGCDIERMVEDVTEWERSR